MQQKKLELLAPAGDWERLEMALAYGADAVYLAGNTFGMRSFAGNFSPEELRRAAKLCRERGVDLHVTCNTMPRNDEMARLPQWLELLEEAGVTAVILADVGVLALAKRYAPSVKIHISTQASIVNYQTATAWHDLWADRVILARELSLDEIAEIRAKTPNDLEIETFGHGAMCVSYSGRCLLSNYMTGRDANRGACAQPCRYQYALVEEKRPGEYFPVYEDEKGTYIMNSRDMCMIDHLPDLIRAGVDSIKIEGRAKSAYYAAIVTGAYRHCIDAVQAALDDGVIGLVDLLHLGLGQVGQGVVHIVVRVILLHQGRVGAFDLLIAGGRTEAQHGIGIVHSFLFSLSVSPAGRAGAWSRWNKRGCLACFHWPVKTASATAGRPMVRIWPSSGSQTPQSNRA